MEKTKMRLLRVAIPFIIMVIVGRLTTQIFAELGFHYDTVSLISVILSSFVGILFFRLGQRQSIDSTADAAGAGQPDAGSSALHDGDDYFPEHDTVIGQILHLVACVAGMIVIMYMISQMFDTEAVNVERRSIVGVISLIVVHPILEEYIFRYLFYRELRPMQPIFACLTQSVMFAIVHNTIGGMLYSLAAGLMLVLIYERTGTLLMAVLAHSIVNLRSYLFMTLLSGAEFEYTRTVIDFIILSVGIAAALVLMIRRNLIAVRISGDEKAGADGGVDNDNDNNDDAKEI